MNKINLEKGNTYEVLLRSYISDFDRKVLVNLYQPLCGAKAIALFFSLWGELEFDKTISKIEKTHEGLLNSLGFTTTEFVQCRHFLEALGLIRTLYHDGHYLYLLFSPKDPKHFFDYEPYDCLLKNKIGVTEYEKARAYFGLAHIDEDKYIDISQDFNDAFVLNTANYKHQSSSDLIGHDSYSAPIKFDFASFYASLKEFFIKADVVTKEIENEIALLAATYHLSVPDMVRIVYKSLDENGKINEFSLRKFARLASIDNGVSGEEVAPVNIETGSEEYDALVKDYNELTPFEFLSKRSFGQPMERDVRLIMEMAKKTGLPGPVINALVDYCLKKNENRLNRNYLETIAGSLIRNRITDAYDAMVYLNEPRKTKKATKVTPKKEVEKVEDADIEVSDEEYNEALAILEELKKGRK